MKLMPSKLVRIQGGPTKRLEDASISDETDTPDIEMLFISYSPPLQLHRSQRTIRKPAR